MDQVFRSCNASADYPKNLIQSNIHEFMVLSYFDKLNDREEDLFSAEDKAALEFWELGAGSKGTSG